MYIVVLTHPRPNGVSYLADTLDALLREGANVWDRCVVADGETPEVSPHWPVKCFPFCDNLTGMMNAFRTFLSSDWDRLLFFEDDVAVCKNAVQYISGVEIPEEWPFITFHDCTQLPNADDGMHAVRFNAMRRNRYIGNQCMLFSRNAVQWLVDQAPETKLGRIGNQSDITMGKLFRLSLWRAFGVHKPALVKHIGEVSAAHPGMGLHIAGRSPLDYRDGYDALRGDVG